MRAVGIALVVFVAGFARAFIAIVLFTILVGGGLGDRFQIAP